MPRKQETVAEYYKYRKRPSLNWRRLLRRFIRSTETKNSTRPL